MSDTRTVPYETEYGRLWVEILPAHRDTYYCTTSRDYENFYEFRLRISSYPGDSYADPDYLKVRGHRYTVDTVFAIKRVYGLMEDGRTYSRGLRQESGNPLLLNSASRLKLRAVVDDVLARFQVEHPDWRERSRRMLAAQELHEAQDKATSLRQLLAETEARVETLRTALHAIDTKKVTAA